jgi:hypothetical protein
LCTCILICPIQPVVAAFGMVESEAEKLGHISITQGPLGNGEIYSIVQKGRRFIIFQLYHLSDCQCKLVQIMHRFYIAIHPHATSH